MNEVNANYVKNICEACHITKSNVQRLVHISSLAAFGPAEYTDGEIVNEKSKPHPVTMYGRSKLKGEEVLKSQKEIPYIIIRPTAVYGPREKDLFTVFNMINKGIQTKVGVANQKLTFIYVKDLVVYMINGLTAGHNNISYFISDGKSYSSHEFNETIRTSINRKTLKLTIPLPIIKILGYLSELWGNLTNTYPPLNIDKVKEIKAKSWVCDTSPNQELNYTPKYSLQQGVKETVNWYKSKNWL
jgi:nucleoside-diphosphate-sugar epimerase